MDDADFAGARCYRSQWLCCSLNGATGLPTSAPEALYALCEPAAIYITRLPTEADLAVLDGHCQGITACAFAPDGRRLASTAGDGTLRLWDIESGQEIGRRIHHFAGGSWASLDLAAKRIVQVSGEAWRWLGWLAHDPVSGHLERYPAETPGPLPEYVDQSAARP